MKIKKLFLIIAVLCIFCSINTSAANVEAKVITEFKDTDGEELTVKYKMPLSELTSKMPSYLDVKLEGSDDWVSIPVHWDCVDQYEGVIYGIYVFIPSPTNTDYVYSDTLNMFSIPYYEVTVDSEIQDNENEIRISIQTESDDVFVIKMDQRDSVEEIKTLIAEIKNIPADTQKLMFNGEELDDTKTIAEQGIQHESTIILTVLSTNAPAEGDSPTNGDSSTNKDSSPEDSPESNLNTTNPDVNSNTDLENTDSLNNASTTASFNARTETTVSSAVRTGDADHPVLWSALLVLSIIIIFCNKKRWLTF